MRFSTTMFQSGNNTGIEVPADVLEALGAGKRPPVVVTVNGYSYRSTVAPMGGQYLLPFSAERRSESGISTFPRICAPRSTARRTLRRPGRSCPMATGRRT
jgi:hypothetical protein